MANPRKLVNALSLSRIGLAFLLVICFQRNMNLFVLSVGICVAALATDILDGYMARRLRVASIHGRLWDSLGDKSFYAAIILSFHAHGFLDSLISWTLIVREIALYITRALFIEKLPRLEEIRPWTNWHGYFLYLTIILGFLRMWDDLHGKNLSLHWYMQVSAYAALFFGVGSILHFLKLQPEPPPREATTLGRPTRRRRQD